MNVRHSLLVVLYVLLGLQLQLVFCQFFPCTFTGSQGTYDLSQISGQIQARDSGNIWTYFIQMCGNALGSGSYTSACTGLDPKSMVCQVPTSIASLAYAIAYPTDQTGTHVYQEIENGISLVAYGSTSSCSNKPRTANFLITCDPTITGPIPTSTVIVNEVSATCTYNIPFSHAAGCPSSSPPPPPSKFNCTYEGLFGSYDLTPLSAQITATDPDNQWKYFIQMCGVAQGSGEYSQYCQPQNAMVCQSYTQSPQGNTFAIAYTDDHTGPHVFQEIYNGLQLTVYGESCTESGQPAKYRTAEFLIHCDPSITGPITALDTYVVEGPAACSYTFQISHAVGCPQKASTLQW